MTIFGTAATIPPPRLRTEKLETRDSPQQLFAKIQEQYEEAFLLESAKGATRLAEYSFIGFEPSAIFRVKNGELEIDDRVNGGRECRNTSDPLEDLRAKLGAVTRREGPYRFIGGAVGYISYDSVRYWERLPSTAKDDLSVPDMEFGIYTDGIAFDHVDGEVSYYSLRERQVRDGAPPAQRQGGDGLSGIRPQEAEHHQGEVREDGREGKGVHRRGRHLPGGPVEAPRLRGDGRPDPVLRRAEPDKPLPIHVLPEVRQERASSARVRRCC